MKDRKVILLVIAIMVIGIVIGKTYNYMNRDSIKFKNEYESLNNKKSESGKKIRSLSISKNNPIKYATAEEIVEKMDNKETFAVYFGFAKCPWCRSVLPTLFEVAEELEINEIYYVDVLEIRDQLELNKEKDVVIKEKGTDGYYELLRRFDEKLSKYILKTEDGEEVDTLERRIYAPNIASVVAGKPFELKTGISESQDDAYMKLTPKMKKDMKKEIECVLKCLSKKTTTCSDKMC